jgi:chitin synthase
VYTAIVGTVMLAALLEWILWLGAFNYCLMKAWQKAENWATRILAVLIGFAFTALRYASMVPGNLLADEICSLD